MDQDADQNLSVLERVRHFALDLDGTLYLGGKLFPFTHRFLETVRELGMGRTFFTNNSSKSTREYIQRLNLLGIDAKEEELFSSTTCTLEHLREELPQARRLFVLGTPALREEFEEAGYTLCGQDVGCPPDRSPEAVVVGFDTTLTYDRLSRAAYWIAQGRPFIATHCDAVCPTDLETVLPDCGAMCKLLTHATGREPDAVLGKPHPRMLRGVMKRHGLNAHEIAVVGDRLYTDVAMAHGAGAVGVLVLSGETTKQQAEQAQPKPHLVVADVGELADRLLDVRRVACQKA